MPPSVQHALADPAGRRHRPLRTEGVLRDLATEERKRSFLRMVSHELRTPLNSIIGFSEIISRELYGPLNEPRYRDHAKIVHESGLRLLKLVNDILEIARLESGAMDLDLRPERPVAAIEETMATLSEEADARQIRLHLAPSADTPAVIADSRALQTILTNLLQNALAYSPAGSAVEVTTRAAGEDVLIEIRDHGPGVSPEDLLRIMRPFEQAENALVRRSEGAGLGLAIVKLLCVSMQGELTLRSPPGEGVTATVRLPAAGGPVAVERADGLPRL